MKLKLNRDFLEELYFRYNRREYVHPDPVEFLYEFDDVKDREIAALVASTLAYGRVRQILVSVKEALFRMENCPHSYLMNSSDKKISKSFSGFKHRFTTGEEFSKVLINVKRAAQTYGSLEGLLASELKEKGGGLHSALEGFVQFLSDGVTGGGLLPRPSLGSACKRLNLFLRWMVRSDEVDPGGWGAIPASKLVVPLDTHMYKIGREFGLTRRGSADMRTAGEITAAFAAISPDDPIKYDFSLTRFGIRDELNLKKLKRACHLAGN